VGLNALSTTATTNANTALGYNAGTANVGAENTFIGYEAGGNVTSGGTNTFLGFQAGHYLNAVTTGSDNTVVGAYARTSSATVSNEGVYGRFALGQGANTVTLGISGNGVHIPLDGSTTSWSAHSDERLKENIEDSTAGLSFINDLRPITYNWKSKKNISEDFVNYYDADSDEPVQGQVKQTNHGFIAQEIKAAIDAHPEIKEGHSIWRESPDGIQNVAAGALIPMLVKSVQELSTQVDELKSELLALKGE
jgi:trimeric autotransporter adhesin